MSDVDYSASLADQIGGAIRAPWRGRDTVNIPLECACGVTQFLHAHASNLRDVDRLNKLDAMGDEWHVTIAGKVIGSGRIREAIDEALGRISK